VLRRSSLRFLTALALLVGHVSGVAHLLLVEHERCPEHGELVHAHARPQSRPSLAAGAVMAPPPQIAADGDDHCLACASQSQSAGAARPVGRPALLLVRMPPVAAREANVPRRYLLSLAPKTSPPSVG